MGSIISAIYDDIHEYEALCDRYGEKIQYSHGSADCYGAHASGLKKRRDQDYQTRLAVERAQREHARPAQDDARFVTRT